MQENTSVFNYPGDFSLKVMGRNTVAFETAVFEIILQAGSMAKPETCQRRPSQNGNFISLEVTFYVSDKTQLQIIYHRLKQHELVLMIL